MKPYTFSSQSQVDQYNFEVANYNRKLATFSDCIDTYLKGAKLDIQRIQEKAEEAIRKYNQY